MAASAAVRPGQWAGHGIATAILVLVMTACGDRDGAKGDPVALQGTPSGSCSQAIADGHNNEAAGRSAPFLPSVRECGSLDAWIQAAKDFGIDLKGREAQFVDNTCNVAGAELKSLKICQEAAAAANDPRRIP